MAFIHGKNTAFKLDNAAGTLVDISTYLTEVGYPESIDVGETTTFGATASAKTYIVGLNDRTISLSGNWDSALDTIISAVIAAQAAGTVLTGTYEYGPAGTTATNIKYTGETVITSYEVSNPVGDIVTFSCELQCTGSQTRTTWP
jgi:hypothetical protein